MPKKKIKIVVVGDKTLVVTDDIIRNVMSMFKKTNSISDVYLLEGTPLGRIVESWSKDNGITSHLVPADFDKYKAGAGYARNKHIINEIKPTHLIAFPGKKVVADMLKRAKANGLIVHDLTNLVNT